MATQVAIYSGTICGNAVKATNVFVSYGSASPNVGPLIRTTHTSGTPAVDSGDSGGPTFVSTTTTGQVRAAAIISGVENGTGTCSGEQGRQYCSPTALIVPLSGALSAVGGGAVLQINTND